MPYTMHSPGFCFLYSFLLHIDKTLYLKKYNTPVQSRSSFKFWFETGLTLQLSTYRQVFNVWMPTVISV